MKFYIFHKNAKPGGGSEGGLAKDHTFSGYFFVHPSLSHIYSTQKIGRPYSDRGALRPNATDFLVYIKSEFSCLFFQIATVLHYLAIQFNGPHKLTVKGRQIERQEWSAADHKFYVCWQCLLFISLSN